MPRSVLSGVQQFAPGSVNCSKLIMIVGRLLVSVGSAAVGPVTGSAWKMMLSVAPLRGTAGGLPATSPGLVDAPPGTAVAEMKRSRGAPDRIPPLTVGGTITQPSASGTITAGGTGPPKGGGGGGGGVAVVPPEGATTMDCAVSIGLPKLSVHGTTRSPTTTALTAAPVIGMGVGEIAGLT